MVLGCARKGGKATHLTGKSTETISIGNLFYMRESAHIYRIPHIKRRSSNRRSYIQVS